MNQTRKLSEEEIALLHDQYKNVRDRLKNLSIMKDKIASTLKEYVINHGEDVPSNHSSPSKKVSVFHGTETKEVVAQFRCKVVEREDALEYLKDKLSRSQYRKVVKTYSEKYIDYDVLRELIETEEVEDSVLDDLFKEESPTYAINID